MKGEFQKQNRKYLELWQKWGNLAKLAAAVFVVFTLYSIIRDQVSSSLTDKSAEALKVQAKAVAKLPAKQSNDTGVRKFLKDQHQRSQDIKEVQTLARMTSALEILRKISDASPGKNSIALTVRRVSIQNNRVELEGSVNRAQDVVTLQNSLVNLSANGKVETIRGTILNKTGVPFAFGFNVDRGINTK